MADIRLKRINYYLSGKRIFVIEAAARLGKKI